MAKIPERTYMKQGDPVWNSDKYIVLEKPDGSENGVVALDQHFNGKPWQDYSNTYVVIRLD